MVARVHRVDFLKSHTHYYSFVCVRVFSVCLTCALHAFFLCVTVHVFYMCFTLFHICLAYV